jgi:outer membrane protein OmpU|tara:strand:- start:109 stop:1134 length:1026 start_codon:yes stop_codon:yes gene_type:complete
MNNFKKIGVSALAASLASVSAHAVELSVNGYWEMTYVNKQFTGDVATNNTGNTFGSKSAIEFSGSGDVNGMTAAVYTALNDANNGMLSHMITLDMGDMGMVGLDQSVGKFGFSTIDDKSPTAYEESWHGTSFSSPGLGATGGNDSTLGYSNSFAGYNVSIEYSPDSANTDQNGDGGSSGVGGQGSNVNFAITTASLMDGLDIGFGAGSTSDTRVKDATSQEQSSIGGYANYAYGPVTVGYTRTYTSGALAGTAANAVDAYGIAFNVNENLSISMNQHDNEFKKTSSSGSAQADVTQESKGLAAAYTMGAAAIRIQQNDVDNVGGVTGTNEEYTELSLFLSF